VLDATKRPSLEDILSDPFMSDPIPKTLPRSTLACPPAKNFTDQYTKQPSGSTAGQLSQKGSASNFERVGKKESEKDLNVKPANKEVAPSKPENFGSSGSNFRASSKDIKQASSKNIAAKEPSSSKKGSDAVTQRRG
jgi:polo-like kinase 1